MTFVGKEKRMYKKRKIISAVIVVILALLMIVPAIVVPYRAEAAQTKGQLKNEISELQSQLADIKNNQKSLQDLIASIQNEQQDKIKYISQLDAEIDIVTNELETVNQLIDKYQKLVDEKYEEKEELEIKQDEQQTQLDAVLRLSYEYGNDSYWEILLGAEDFSDFLSRLDYLAYHLGSSSDILDELDTTYNQLVETTEIYESSLVSIDEYRASSEQLQRDLEVKKGEAEQALALLNDQEKAELDNLAKYQEEREQTNREIANLSAELKKIEDEEKRKKAEEEKRRREQEAKNNAGKQQSGKSDTAVQSSASAAAATGFAWPLSGYNTPSGAYISSGFGYRTNPITFKSEFHNGVDLPAPKGTPIYAPADGTVSSAGVKGGYGNCVVISHGGGVVTLYGHADTLCVSSGQKVKKGDLIARVGTTGQSTGNHLHYTIYEGGTAINPMTYY